MINFFKKNKVFLVICLFTLITGSIFWLSLKNIFFNGKGGVQIVFDYFYLFLDLLFYVAFYCLSFILFPSWRYLLVIGLLGIFPIFLTIPFHLIILLGLIAFALMFLLGFKSIRNELRERINIDVYAICYSGVTYILSGIFILIITFYYLSPTLNIATSNISIPKPIIERATMFAQSFLKEEGLLPKENVVISDDFFDFVNRQLRHFVANFKNHITFIFAVGLFFVLRTFNFLIVPLVAFVVALILKIFIYFKSISIKDEIISVKRLAINF